MGVSGKLTSMIHDGRVSLLGLFKSTETKVDELSKQYTREEQAVAQRVKSAYRDPPGTLVPGVSYAVLAMMAGSIVTKRYSWPLRVFVPFGAGLVALDYSLPLTMGALRDRVYNWEQASFPVLTKKQDEIAMELREGWKDCKDFWGKIQEKIGK
ncbi:Mic26p KNAG_0A01530 [Huiozyma naganishii CBS 8797]|uniref:MICOS complex subunit n=1 Tax=Huiozyma naganishii (strain ATCC MYA-139 / BCRC 22969 / CBS 8797 / KCTC 17520 / NBRC 10181 / NCYC 3082 / Yp74L-3) TaxID=1071383 RepID=J7RT17_HUIN7|nr:hypothetical protein KNAG_0A01530 [Kazachstania naganishii CBS 8797]CCK67842.1 hypothetical protein KNAG_0A01530 [Kazachstania naganishii CBS 8797]